MKIDVVISIDGQTLLPNATEEEQIASFEKQLKKPGHLRELEAAVDAEIKEFEQWFTEHLKNSRLVGPEKAILKTYLGYKSRLYK